MEKEKKINVSIFQNIIIAVIIVLYYILINLAYYRVEENILNLGLKIASMVVLILSIITFEIAYKKDRGKIAIYGIEILVVASHTLSIMHVIEKFKINFTTYILISSCTFGIYYILKVMIIYTLEKRKYLKNLSDIKEIVKNKPTKKEATKKKK